jgi:hypothetical protein
MSCICIAGSNQLALDLVAKVLKESGMNLLEGDEGQTSLRRRASDKVRISVNGPRISITPERFSQIMQSAQTTELFGWGDSSNLNSLTEWFRIDPTLYFVLVTSKAVDVIAQALDDYENVFDCSEVVASWQQSQKKLLHFFYRHRERCFLVDSQDCLENAQDFVRECKQSFSVALEVPKAPLSAWPTLQNSVSLHFAQRLLESYPEALSLENELKTCVRMFADAQGITSQIEHRGVEHKLLRDYRAQRQQSQASHEQWEHENTALLSKLVSIQTENQQLFNQYQLSQRQSEILLEEADADRNTIAKLNADLELSSIEIAKGRVANNDLIKKNEELLFTLHEVQRTSEVMFERNINLEAQVKALDSKAINNLALAELRQVDLDQAFQKNMQLLEKQVEVEAENELLLTQFQQSLIDLESYILKNRSLQSQISVEQESTKALEARLHVVISEYETLDQAHTEWRAERETLIEQIDLKHDALTTQREEAERVSTEQQAQFLTLQEKQVEIEAECEIILSQFHQSLIDLELYVLKSRTFQSQIAVEQESTNALEARLHEVISEYESLDQAHVQWRAERKTLIEQIELKQNALNIQSQDSERVLIEYELQLAALHEKYGEIDDSPQSEFCELKNAHEALLVELSQEQIHSEQQFIKNEQNGSKLKALELEKIALESRLLRILKKYPVFVNCERIEVLDSPSGDLLKTQWQVVGLETGKRFQPSLSFFSIIEDSALGLIFSRQQAANNGLIRWPEILSTYNELVLSPVGNATTGPIRAETWLSLATTDLDTVIALSLALEKELKNDGIVKQLGQKISSRLLAGLEAFKHLSSETQSTFRYDRVRLKRATVNDDYEHLWLEFDHVSYGQIRLSNFECRIACAELISKRFGSFPKLEFPRLEYQQSLTSWYAESHDDFGDKLELRFAPPALFDVEVWDKLKLDDQGLILSLLERLPTILRELDLDQSGLHRPWPQWTGVVEHMSRCLEPAMTALPVGGTPAIEPPAPKDWSPQAQTIRPTSRAFLSFLQES